LYYEGKKRFSGTSNWIPGSEAVGIWVGVGEGEHWLNSPSDCSCASCTYCGRLLGCSSSLVSEAPPRKNESTPVTIWDRNWGRLITGEEGLKTCEKEKEVKVKRT
jgi:hypothetical protein